MLQSATAKIMSSRRGCSGPAGGESVETCSAVVEAKRASDLWIRMSVQSRRASRWSGLRPAVFIKRRHMPHGYALQDTRAETNVITELKPC